MSLHMCHVIYPMACNQINYGTALATLTKVIV